MTESAGSSATRGGRGLRIVLRVVLVVALLYFFLSAIQMMGGAFKLLGKDFAESLVAATRSPFTALFIGILATAVIQSSSVTTSMVVGLVSGGVIPVESAIPIIMGANIGTSVTNTIVSFGHVRRKEEFRRAFSGAVIHDVFNWMSVAILLPIELATGFLQRSAEWLAAQLYGSGGIEFHSPIKAAVKPIAKGLGKLLTDVIGLPPGVAGTVMLVVALALIFFCLAGLVKLLRALASERMEGLIHRALAKGPIVTMGIGVVATVTVQSSSITTSILVPLVATGLVQLRHAFPITLGANVGTTITALLAALAGNVHGLAIALVHLMFNVCGILLLYPFPAIREVPLNIARRLGDLAARSKGLALGLVLGAFFGLPLAVVLIEKALG